MEEQIKEILEKQTETIKKMTEDKIKESIAGCFHYAITENLEILIENFIKKELAKDIKKMLVEIKPDILLSLKDAVVKGVAVIGKKMVENMTKNIVGYSGGEILKKLVDD